MKQSLIYVAVLLLSLCSTASAKKKTDNPETVKLKSKIENVMLKVDAQPDWLYSRLQMFWNTHATDVFINGEQFDHPGGERAAEPTVKYNGTRGMETQYNRPKLEDILPYDDDEQGNVTYINKVTGKMEKTSPAKTKFVTKTEDEKVIEAMNGQREITMTMWMKADKNRTIFKALSPANLEYERMPNQPYNIEKQPVLTFVARQKGEAWNHPFVCVYEPSSDTESGDIASIDYFEPSQKGAVGIIVKLKDGTEQRIVCSENGKMEIKQ